MGASDFSETAAGRDAKEAFRSAVEGAQFEYGHGGYSGTIAEKGGSGFRMLPALPARWTAAKAEGLIAQAQYGESYRTANGEWKTRSGSQAKALEALRSWLGTSYEVNRLVEAADDKWGPALCVEVSAAERKAHLARQSGNAKRGTRVFRFFGMASS